MNHSQVYGSNERPKARVTPAHYYNYQCILSRFYNSDNTSRESKANRAEKRAKREKQTKDERLVQRSKTVKNMANKEEEKKRRKWKGHVMGAQPPC